MHRRILAALLMFLVVPVSVRAQSVEGNWKFNYVTNGIFEQALAIVALKDDNGKVSGELVAARLAKPTFESVAKDGGMVRVVLKGSGLELVFEGVVPKEATKEIRGTVAIDGTLYPGSLSQTDAMKLAPNASVRVLPCPPLTQVRGLAAKVDKLRQAVLKEKDDEKKQALIKQFSEADETAKKETPRLNREVMAKYTDSPVVFDVGLSLIRSAKANDAKVDEVKAWASTLADASKAFGPRWQSEINGQLALALVSQDGYGPLALDYARQAERTLTDKTPPTEQVRVLTIVARVLKKNSKTDEAAKLEAQVNKLDEVLDRAYIAKGPGFKGEAFTGRTSKSDRAVFMELFTGATCPPCVAADLAFDVLQRTYKPSELVLIQYHLHVPGPDPLTNRDTEARWKYYRAAYPDKVRGVPTCIFNGAPKAPGGGGAAAGELKYDEYRKVISELIEEDAGAKLIVKAERNGDKVEINVRVTGLAEADAKKKLRVLLTEETVRYLGSNRIRLHHNVVRACPGGVDGTSLKESASRHSFTINLADLRTQLTGYLDEYETNTRPFANPSRPLTLSHLRVIAFVQDDNNREILQAVQVDLK